MGDYTKLVLKTKIRQNEYAAFTSVLDAARRQDLEHLPSHAFFRSARWAALLHECSLTMCADGPMLEMDTKVKNYGGEIGLFCDWLSPMVPMSSEGQYIGHTESLEFSDGNTQEILTIRCGSIVAEQQDD